MPLHKSATGIPPLSIATSSLNPFPAHSEPPYDLVSKLRAIAHAGFNAIELAFPDLLSFASQHLNRQVGSEDWIDLCVAAKEIRQECKLLGVDIMMLQPFSNFEGWDASNEEGKAKKEDAFERARGWIRIMAELGTDMLQVGSTDASNIIADKTQLAADLAELADMLAEHNMRLAYENWCWATVAPTWRDIYEIVKLVDRPNIGLCLDTFQTAGGEWGDPTTTTGRIKNLPEPITEKAYLRSLKDLATLVPPEKIYVLQVSDAYKPPHPLAAESDADSLKPRAKWSSSFRPMPGNGGYLPVAEMAKAVRNTGFEGWFSIEIFDGGPDGKGKELGNLDEEAKEIMNLTLKFIEEVDKTSVAWWQ